MLMDRIIPTHIAMIMDGNRRWARKRLMPTNIGHSQGAKVLEKIAIACQERGVKYLTVYAFSTENWKRPKEEVDALMDLLYDYLCDADKKLVGRNNKVRIIGNREPLRPEIREKMAEVEKMTENNTGMVLNLAVNYGGREEIANAAGRISRDVAEGKLKAEEIDEKVFSDYMYTAGLPDPDIIMRPSGELRLSNFLLWQAAYSEFWFADMCWPDFTPKHIKRVIYDFQQRDRRFGKV